MKTARSKLTTVHRYTTPICLPTRLQPSYRARGWSAVLHVPLHQCTTYTGSRCEGPSEYVLRRFPTQPSLFQRGRRLRQTRLDWQYTHPDTRGGGRTTPTLSPAIALATVCGRDGW